MQQILDHLHKQYPQHEFKIVTEETDSVPSGLSKDEALDALYDIQLVDLTWNEGREVFEQIVDIIERIRL